VAGLLSGEYHFADALTPEGMARLKNQANVATGVARPANSSVIIFNTRAGLMSDVAMRRAAQAAFAPRDMMAAAFGDPELYEIEGSLYPKGTVWYDAETPGYDMHDPKRAAALAKQAGYQGQKLRILTTTQYDYMYKTVQVAQANLEDAGFAVDVQVMDWATLLQKRQDANLWELFVTGGTPQPDPGISTALDAAYPGWWDTPAKRAVAHDFAIQTDPAKRVEGWKKVQALYYSEVPRYQVGLFYYPYGISTKLSGYTAQQWPYFWNTRLSG
jgi:peptide/nickel transport system substrate-binding protein